MNTAKNKNKTPDNALTTVGLLKQTDRLKEQQKFLKGSHNNTVVFIIHIYMKVQYVMHGSLDLLWSEFMTNLL